MSDGTLILKGLGVGDWRLEIGDWGLGLEMSDSKSKSLKSCRGHETG